MKMSCSCWFALGSIFLGLASPSAAEAQSVFLKCDVSTSSGVIVRYFRTTPTEFKMYSNRSDSIGEWISPCESFFSPNSCTVKVSREYYSASTPANPNIHMRTSDTVTISRLTGDIYFDIALPWSGKCEVSTDPSLRPQKF